MLPVELILTLSVTIGLLTSGLIGSWYVWPRVRAVPARDALMALIFPHCFRYLGLSFLIHGVTTAPLDVRFSFPTWRFVFPALSQHLQRSANLQ